jgi:hypothetical protein
VRVHGSAARRAASQGSRVLQVPYFHVVFTIASELNVVFLYNRKLL